MGAQRIAFQVWAPELETGLQRKQSPLEFPQLRRRHHIDAAKSLKLTIARILGEACFALVIVGTEACALVCSQIRILIFGLQIAQRVGNKPLEVGVRALLRASDLGNQIRARGSYGILPRMAGVQQRLGLAQIRGQRVRLL